MASTLDDVGRRAVEAPPALASQHARRRHLTGGPAHVDLGLDAASCQASSDRSTVGDGRRQAGEAVADLGEVGDAARRPRAGRSSYGSRNSGRPVMRNPRSPVSWSMVAARSDGHVVLGDVDDLAAELELVAELDR